jgi:TonB-linked SusC/RagA family outer membrane protein
MQSLSLPVRQLAAVAPSRPCGLVRLILAVAIAFTVAAPELQAQSGVVAGTVRRSVTLTPIEGARVEVEGTQLSTTTDAAGRFRITDVPGTSVRLQVRRLSFTAAAQQVAVGSTDIRVLLAESAVRLDEVVVTGTAVGTQSRAIGNAVSTINAVDEVEKSGIGDLGSLLNARASGVIVTSGSGRIGSGPSINIRGRNTISLSQQPLLYIDGVRVVNDIATGTRFQGGSPASRLNDISPEDIESIEIIKGPAASTIYGTEAANGVIQIITKKGRANAAPVWIASLRQGTQWFQDPEGRLPTNYATCSTAAQVAATSLATDCRGQAIGTVVTWDGVEQENARGTPIWKNGHLQTYNGSLSGGLPLVRYYMSGTYDNDKGIEPNNKLNRFSGHANLVISPSDKVDVSSSLTFVRGKTHLGAEYGAGSMWGTLYGSPLSEGGPGRGFNLYPPEAVWGLFENTQDVARFTASGTVNHRPTSWLTQRFIVGIDETTEDNQGLQKFAPAEFTVFQSPTANKGQLLQDLRNITFYSADYSGSANFDLTSAISSTSSIGGQFYKKYRQTTQTTGREFPAPGLRTTSAAAIREGSQDYTTNTTVGMFVQQQFGWQDRLFLTAAIRADDNSAFGEDFDFVTYPKLSGTWIISEESFWQPARSAVNTLKLRAAYGQSGQQPDVFTALRTYQPVTGLNDQPAVSPQFFGNPDLKPERGQEIEAGFEAGLFERVSLDFTFFSRRTKDAILERPIAPSTGFPGRQFVNIGEVSNGGIELKADVQAIARENLGLELGLNLGTSKDKITDLGEISFIAQPGLPQRHVEGYPINGYWAKRVTSATMPTTPTGLATNVMCDNGAGGEAPCATAPVVFLGTPTPKLTGAFTGTLSIGRNLRLFGLVDFKRGHKMLDTDNAIRCAIFRICEVNVNPQKFSPQYVANAQNGSALVIVDQFIKDASFTKLREVSASYTLPDRFARYTRAGRAVVTMAGRNLHTWTSYTGLDPESRASIGTAAQFDQAITPSVAQFITTITLTF